MSLCFKYKTKIYVKNCQEQSTARQLPAKPTAQGSTAGSCVSATVLGHFLYIYNIELAVFYGFTFEIENFRGGRVGFVRIKLRAKCIAKFFHANGNGAYMSYKVSKIEWKWGAYVLQSFQNRTKWSAKIHHPLRTTGLERMKSFTIDTDYSISSTK